MSRDPFAGVLDPFAWWDISGTYDKYAGFFDLVIYSSIFIAVAHVVFTGRFTGRPGKVMATAIGIALGVSLAVVEQQFGWSLRQAGPFAVLIALLLVGFLLLQVLLRIHVSWALAVPLTYVLVYLLIRAMSPSLFDLIAARIPFLNLLSAVIFLICIWQIGVAVWPKRQGSDAGGQDNASFVAGLERKNEKREIRVEKRLKGRAIPEVRRETKRLERNLQALQNELRRENPDMQSVARALSDIAHGSDSIVQEIDRIRVLDRRLRNFDWHELQELGRYYQELTETDRTRLKEQIDLERKKIVQEHAIVELAERCERRQQEFRSLLDQASKTCFASDRAGAAQHISAAIAIEHQQKEDLNRLKDAEKRLLVLTKLKLRKEA